jgi:hypothetical protein
LALTVVDKATGAPVAARMHLWDARGRTPRVGRVVRWADHFVFPGKVILRLPPGDYSFEIERGLEYRLRTGRFTIQPRSQDHQLIELVRFADLAQEGWYAGDLHVQRPLGDMPLLMDAEDIYVAPVLTWTNTSTGGSSPSLPPEPLPLRGQRRFYHPWAGRDERAGGQLLMFRVQQPPDLDEAQSEFPASVEFARRARRQPDAHITAGHPFAWDAPVWAAHGCLDSYARALCDSFRSVRIPGRELCPLLRPG